MPETFKLIETASSNVLDIWQVESNGHARCLLSYLGHLTIRDNKSLLDELSELYPTADRAYSQDPKNLTVQKIDRHFGEYHSRVFRPSWRQEWRDSPAYIPPPRDNIALSNALTQLEALKALLSSIFRTVEPDQKNFSAYGHEIRNLMLIACTEVESQLKAVLLANNISAQGNSYSTRDYVKLSKSLKLKEYSMRVASYPQIGVRMPFKDWNSSAPTKSLDWYDAYNAVKHDRENSFCRAMLVHAIDAVLACAILLEAQYGWIPLFRDQRTSEYVCFEKRPNWTEDEQYLPHRKSGLNHAPWTSHVDLVL